MVKSHALACVLSQLEGLCSWHVNVNAKRQENPMICISMPTRNSNHQNHSSIVNTKIGWMSASINSTTFHAMAESSSSVYVQVADGPIDHKGITHHVGDRDCSMESFNLYLRISRCSRHVKKKKVGLPSAAVRPLRPEGQVSTEIVRKLPVRPYLSPAPRNSLSMIHFRFSCLCRSLPGLKCGAHNFSVVSESISDPLYADRSLHGAIVAS